MNDENKERTRNQDWAGQRDRQTTSVIPIYRGVHR